MEKEMNLSSDPIPKLFLKFLIPAVTGTLVTAFYGVVDGIFIGQGLGGAGLAAVNIGYPVVNFIVALALAFGAGGATLVSIYESDKNYKNKCFTHTIGLNIVSYILIVLAILAMGDNLFYILGSNKELMPMVKDYVYTCSGAGIFLMLSITLSSIVRNDRAPNYAMKAMLLGAVTNIILDYVFIFQMNMGMKGAALATGIGQLLSTLFLIKYFFSKKCSINLSFQKIDFPLLFRIFYIGFPSFILEFAVAFITVLFTKAFFKYIGEVGVSAFAIVGYIFYIFRMLFNGLAQGIQPIVSYNYGKKEAERIKKIFFLGHKISLAVSIILLLFLKFEGHLIVKLFNDDLELINLANRGLLLYSSAMIFVGANFINISYLQSKDRAGAANIISIGRSMVFVTGALFFLPETLGIDGIWLALPCSDFLTFLTSLTFKSKKAA